MYIVVYEVINPEFGDCGIRYTVAYPDRNEFLGHNHEKEGKISILIKNVSFANADELLCQTPDISYLTNAIDESCNEAGMIDIGILSLQMETARISILRWRAYRRNHVIPCQFGSLVVKPSDKNTQRDRLLTITIIKYIEQNLKNIDLFISLIMADANAIIEIDSPPTPTPPI